MIISMSNRLINNTEKFIESLFFSLTNEQIDKSSTVTLFAEEVSDLGAYEKKQDTTKSRYFNLILKFILSYLYRRRIIVN